MTTFASDISRRTALMSLASASVPLAWPRLLSGAEPARKPKSVAAIITHYTRNSHADVIVGKILEGWRQDGGPGPALKLASMYIDQFPEGDLARTMSERHGVPIVKSIGEAITLGGKQVAVDGVLSIGEHGDYPWNDKRQHLYPRRRFFSAIADTLEQHGRAVPVFNDKHLGPVWDDALWMYQRARMLGIPLMAGSSIPLAYRRPDVSIPLGCDLRAAVGVGFSELDTYGFHTLEFYQCFVERRRGAESGVDWVQCLTGPEMWKVVDEGRVRKDLLDAALDVVPCREDVDRRTLKGDDVVLFLFGYRDGFTGAVFMLHGLAQGIGVAVDVGGQTRATFAEEREEPAYPHFACLVKAIEDHMHAGRPPYPLERTLLTGGTLDRLLTSLHSQCRRRETPELAIAYQPVTYPHAPHLRLTQ